MISSFSTGRQVETQIQLLILPADESRIVGGQPANIDEHPYQVSIRNDRCRNWRRLIGGNPSGGNISSRGLRQNSPLRTDVSSCTTIDEALRPFTFTRRRETSSVESIPFFSSTYYLKLLPSSSQVPFLKASKINHPKTLDLILPLRAACHRKKKKNIANVSACILIFKFYKFTNPINMKKGNNLARMQL